MPKGKSKAASKARKAPEPVPDAVHRPFAALAKSAKKKATAESAAAKPAGRAAPAAPAAATNAAASGASEADTFAAYMAGVRALDGKGKARVARSDNDAERRDGAAPKVDLDATAREALRTLVAEGKRIEAIDDGERIEGRRVDLDPRELRRLKRGEHAIDAHLDLHGLTLPEARERVNAFVRKRAAEGDRVIAIVHGKGKHSARGVAVLRGEIAAWLGQGPASRYVLAFATAPESEGGSGVLLAMLTR